MFLRCRAINRTQKQGPQFKKPQRSLGIDAAFKICS